MAPVHLARLQKRSLRWVARDAKRSRGMIARAHQERSGALPTAPGNSSHRRRLVESPGFVGMGRTLGGQAESFSLTAAGHQRGAHLSEVMQKG